MREDIVREYANLFNITKTVAQYLERMIGLPITDSEIAYLTLHFGAFLKIAEKENPKLRILIVNPVLTNEDRRYILNHSLVQNCRQGGLADRLFETIKNYVSIANHDALKKDILNCLQGSQFANELEENEHKGILDFLTPDKIVITDENFTWTDAVYFAENRNAKIILMLSAEDNERHLGIMNDIWKMAQNESGMTSLTKAADSEDAVRILKNLLT